MAGKERIVKVTTEECACDPGGSGCAIVRAIAERAADSFNILADCYFDSHEDMLIFEQFMRLHYRGLDREAAGLLLVVFSIMEQEQSIALLSAVTTCRDEAAVAQFVTDFAEHTGRTAHYAEKAFRGKLN